jgi:hypothetical protein
LNLLKRGHVRPQPVLESAEANRIFGFDAWDRRTISTACVWSGQSAQWHAAAYTAKVRISVRAGDTIIEGREQVQGKAKLQPRGKRMS